MSPGWLRELGDIQAELRSHPARALNTLGALGLGIAVIGAVLAIVTGLEDRADAAVRSLGQGVIAIANAGTSDARTAGLESRHSEVLRRNLRDAKVTAVRRYPAPTRGVGLTLEVMETDPEFLAVRRWRLVDGRFLDEHDMRTHARVAAISHPLAERHGWRTGESILVGSLVFSVIGIVEAAVPFGATESAVLVPATAAPRWHIDSAYPDQRVDELFVSTEEGGGAALDGARTLLSDPALSAGDLDWTTAATLTREVRDLQFLVAAAGGGASVLVLALGGGLLAGLAANNVRERSTEIGLRRAIGATSGDITRLFVLESVVLSAAAGTAAISLALPVMMLVADGTGIPFRITIVGVAIPVLAAIAVASAAAWWPARRAAALAPGDAMRAR